MPSVPLPSPATVRALKVNWRPPLTVLETRLTAMSFSIIPSSISSRLLRPRESRSLAIVVSCREEVITAAAAYCWGSEEHTSELQSLMRISYAVFCLKKKNRRQLYDVHYSRPYPT